MRRPSSIVLATVLLVTLILGGAWASTSFLLTATAPVTATGAPNTTSSTHSSATTSTISSSSKTTTSVSTFTSEYGFTVNDELSSLGSDIWEIELYFPTFGAGLIIDAIRGSSSCPCQISSVSQPTPTTVRIIAANGITITSTPSEGYEKIVIGPNFVANNFMPGVAPGDMFEHWQNASVFRFTGLVTPYAFPSANGYSSYGMGKLTRGGVDYFGFGVYIHATAMTISDPRPGVFFQFGWTPTSSYILFVAKTGTQDLSAEVFPSGQVVPTKVTVTTNTSCMGFTYTFSSITVTYNVSRFLGGTSAACAGETFGPFSDSHGNSGVMWALVGR